MNMKDQLKKSMEFQLISRWAPVMAGGMLN
jgi:hypothetical protein